MADPNFFILYVNNPPASTDCYTTILGKGPIEASPTFAMFALESGVMMGLWSRLTVEPAAETLPGSGEIAFSVADRAEVDAKYQEWSGHGIRIVQTPTAMDFGHTFVALDPDGHRLRVFAPQSA
jgi:catechol 2,3-dioxygenase-like lactoylglutathione lyase family enzyme